TAERAPTTTRSTARSSTTKRFFRLASMMALSIGRAPRLATPRSVAAPGPDGALHDLGLEQERPGGDDLLPRHQAPAHLHGVGPAERHGANPLRPIDALLLLHEDHVRLLVPLHGPPGDDEGLVRLADPDACPAELAGPEQAVAIGQLGPHLGRPRLLVHLGPDP